MRVVAYSPSGPRKDTSAVAVKLPTPPIIKALDAAGIEIAEWQTFGPSGKPEPPGEEMAGLIAFQLARTGEGRPDAWISVGVGRKRPDLIGLRAARSLKVPYVVVEPDLGAGMAADREAVRKAVAEADAVVVIGETKAQAVAALMGEPERLKTLPPFLDCRPFDSARQLRGQSRTAISNHLRLPKETPWFVVVAPMDGGFALDSYRMLARAFSRLVTLEWRLIISGDGDEREKVLTMFRMLPKDKLRFIPTVDPEDRAALLVSCDVLVWPGLGDVGLDVLLEAQAAGEGVVACRSPGVVERVREGISGRVALADNAESFAQNVGFLLRNPEFLATYARQARETVRTEHDLGTAGRLLREILIEARERGKGPIESS